MWLAGWFCLLVLIVIAPRIGWGWLLASVMVLTGVMAGFALIATRFLAFLATGSICLLAWWMQRFTRPPVH